MLGKLQVSERSVQYVRDEDEGFRSWKHAGQFKPGAEASTDWCKGWSTHVEDLRSSMAWFEGVSWSTVQATLAGDLRPAFVPPPRPRLLGGSSKLAKLAEERKRKAEAAKVAATASSLDHLTLDGWIDQTASEPLDTRPAKVTRKYPSRKRDPTPPPNEPVPEPVEEVIDNLPDLRAPPTAFGHTLSNTTSQADRAHRLQLQDVLGPSKKTDAFTGPSPDDIVTRAQGASRSLNK